MKATLQLRIITRPVFPTKREILLEGDVTDFPNVDTLNQLVFDIERTLNEHMPQIRVHTAINIDDKEGEVKCSENPQS